jgi:hypothetical protein
MTKWFSHRKAAEFFASLLANEPVIQKDIEMLRKTRGLEAAESLRTKDPFVAWEGVHQQLINVIQNALEPHAARATAALNSVSDALANIADRVTKSKVLSDAILAGSAVAGAGGAFLAGGGLMGLLRGEGALSGVAAGGSAFMRWLPFFGGAASIATTPDLLTGETGRRIKERFSAEQARRPDYTFGNVGRFRSSAAMSDVRGLFDVPAAAPGRFPNLPSFKAPIEPFDLSGTAASAMDSFNAVLRAKGEESKAIGANIASALKSLLSFTATPTVVPTVAPGAAPAAPAAAAPSAPGRSSGGNVYEGGVYQIAEHRAEYFAPGQDGTIFPGTGGGEGARATIAPSISNSFGDFHFHGVSDVGEIASAVRGTLEQQVSDSVRGIFSDYGVELA